LRRSTDAGVVASTLKLEKRRVIGSPRSRSASRLLGVFAHRAMGLQRRSRPDRPSQPPAIGPVRGGSPRTTFKLVENRGRSLCWIRDIRDNAGLTRVRAVSCIRDIAGMLRFRNGGLTRNWSGL